MKRIFLPLLLVVAFLLSGVSLSTPASATSYVEDTAYAGTSTMSAIWDAWGDPSATGVEGDADDVDESIQELYGQVLGIALDNPTHFDRINPVTSGGFPCVQVEAENNASAESDLTAASIPWVYSLNGPCTASVRVIFTVQTGGFFPSFADLQATSDALINNGTGVVRESSVDTKRGKVVATVDQANMTDSLRTSTKSAYGDNVAFVLDNGSDSVDQATSRDYDTTPYWAGGGDYFANDYAGVSRCTMGLPWKLASNGGLYWWSVGHCVLSSVNGHTYTGAETAGTDVNLNHNATGHVSATTGRADSITDGSTGSGDLAIINPRYNIDNVYTGFSVANRIFTGNGGSTASIPIGGNAAYPYPGQHVCQSGDSSYQHCFYTVKSVDTTYYAGGRRTYHATVAKSGFQASNSVCTKKGDSGGPVYVMGSNGYAYGAGVTYGGGYEHTFYCKLAYISLRYMAKWRPGVVYNGS